jgi:phytanoyl-CoA hydroxylase
VTLLEDDQIEAYHRDGFLVVPGFADARDCQELMDRALHYVEAFDPTEYRSVFQTDEQTRTSDDWFLSSGGVVRCFLEAEAVDDDGNLIGPKMGSVNKIGHALHDLDDAFDRFSRNPDLAAVAADVSLRNPKLLQSMYIFKNARIGGEVTCHQDATFLYTNPITCTGFWFAIEDATLENGCLWAIPGGHRTALEKRFVRNDPADDHAGTSFEVHTAPITTDGAVPLEAPAGTLVVLHGLLPHFSGPNRSDKKRDAYSLHVIDGDAEYPAENWLQRGPDQPLRGFAAI